MKLNSNHTTIELCDCCKEKTIEVLYNHKLSAILKLQEVTDGIDYYNHKEFDITPIITKFKNISDNLVGIDKKIKKLKTKE